MTIKEKMKVLKERTEELKRLLNYKTPPRRVINNDAHLDAYDRALKSTYNNIPLGYDPEGNSRNPF